MAALLCVSSKMKPCLHTTACRFRLCVPWIGGIPFILPRSLQIVTLFFKGHAAFSTFVSMARLRTGLWDQSSQIALFLPDGKTQPGCQRDERNYLLLGRRWGTELPSPRSGEPLIPSCCNWVLSYSRVLEPAGLWTGRSKVSHSG